MNLLVVIADGWGYTHGGINVFNREMCKGFSNYLSSSTHVICVAPNVSEEEITKVKQEEGLDLICVSEEEFKVPKVIFDKVNSYCKEKFPFTDVSITWLGHDQYSDYQAIECKKMISGSRCAIIHHMSYSTYYPLVNTDTTEILEKEKKQRERLNKADIVFANGPLLLKSAQDLRGGKENVYEILPGVYNVENIKEEYISDTFYVVSFGRVEAAEGTKRNNSIIKQIFLAASAWSRFTNGLRFDQESVMRVYGKSKNDADTDIYDLVKKHFKELHAFNMLPYEEDHEALLNDLANYSLCLVLSSKEGFGLTALEAISAGVPIIVSKSSGFYRSLKERALDGFVHAIDIEATLDEPYYTESDLERTVKEIEEVYYDQENAKKKTIILRDYLIKKGYTWENCARTILEKLDWLDDGPLFDEKKEFDHTEDIVDSENKTMYTLSEQYVLGYDSDISISKERINEAYREAQIFYEADVNPFNFESIWYDDSLFQNINSHDTSIRFLNSQSKYLSEYTIESLNLDVVEAIKYGADWDKCVSSIFWEEEYRLSSNEKKWLARLENMKKRLVAHEIPDSELSTYTIFTLLRNGYSIDELCKKRYDINQLVRYGVTEASLKEYYSDNEIAEAVRNAEKVFLLIESASLGKYEKFGPNYLAKKFDAKSVLEVFPIEEVNHAFDISDILYNQPMTSAVELKNGGYTSKELALNGFTSSQLVAAGYDVTGLTFKRRDNGITDPKAIEDAIDDLVFEIEEEEDQDNFLCFSFEAELLKRLKEKGYNLGQIQGHLPFALGSCQCHIKWLLMAKYTIEELESCGFAWKQYIKFLPSEWIDNDEYMKYQYDGVDPIELVKTGISVEIIKSLYGFGNYVNEYEESKTKETNYLRSQGYTARAFCNMGKTFAEIKESYSVYNEKDILELALSNYDLKELRRAGYSIGRIKDQYELNQNEYNVISSVDIGTRHRMILDFIEKHGG